MFPPESSLDNGRTFRRKVAKSRAVFRPTAQRLEPRLLLAGNVIVSEFMAQNDHLVNDYDLNSPDWIELRNVGSETVDLEGWYLTDDPDDLTKWKVPVETRIDPQQNLVLFASGRDFVAPDGQLHTNFSLSADGEFLALVQADGITVEWQLTGPVPQQFSNVSYGLADRTATAELITLGATGKVVVPDDGTLGTTWTSTRFDDSSWSEAVTGVGFFAQAPPIDVSGFVVRMVDVNGGTDGTLDTATEALDVLEGRVAAGAYDVLLDETRVTPQVDFGGFRGSFGNNQPYFDQTIDSTLDDIAMRARATVTIPAGDWTIGLGADDGAILRLEGVEFIETFNEAADPALIVPGDGELIRNNVGTFQWTRGTFTVGPGGRTTTLDALFFNREGNDAFELAIIGGHATSRPRFDNDWTLLSDGVLGWSVKSLTPPPRPQLSDLVATNLAAEMFQQRTSAYLRVPFTVTDTSALDVLTLRMRYADAFVAYLNGQEVARSNLTGAPSWDATADVARPDVEARTPQSFDISQHRNLLQVGNNVLAIQTLNSSADSPAFLVLPELWSIDQLPTGMTYLGEPTPGESSGAGSIGVLPSVNFSRVGGTFVDSFSLTLTADPAESTIYYTTDGSLPNEASLLYTGPIDITQTSQIGARAFSPDWVPSPFAGQTYIQLAEDAKDFTSDLPLFILENFDHGVPDRDWQTAFAAVIEPDQNGRSRLAGPLTVASTIGMHRRGYTTFTHEKTNYRIEFRDALGFDKDVELLGLPAESDWILAGPWIYDRTMVRVAMMFALSNQIGHYSPRTRFVEVFSDTNGDALSQQDYMGVYVLTEVIKRDPNRVDVAKLERSYVDEPEISGGYIEKIDRGTLTMGSSELPDVWKSSRGGPESFYFNNMDPNGEQLTQAQRDYLLDYVDRFEAALYGPDFTDPELGYEAFIDVDSFLNHHWLRLLTNDPDGLIVSTYWVKDRGKKLQMGPMWDFDRTMGTDSDLRSANPREIKPHYLTYDWWGRLFSDPDFKQRWIDRYQELRRDGFFSNANFGSIIDELTAEVQEAQVRNVARWPDSAPNGGEFADRGLFGYEAEVSHLKGWLRERIAWLDSLFLVPPALSHTGGNVAPGFEVAFAPSANPIYFTTDGTDPRGDGGAVNNTAMRFDGQPIGINQTTKIIARVFDSAGRDMKIWSSPAAATFSTDLPADATNLRVSELYYHPADPTAEEAAARHDDADDFEFIEFTNISDVAISLRDVRLDEVSRGDSIQGIRFTFGPQTLEPGESIVVVSDVDAFRSRFGTGIRMADGVDVLGGTNGRYGGRLSNGGETITLRDAAGKIIQQFAYNDNWYPQTDGGGFSLEVVDPDAADVGRWNEKAGWQPSSQPGGSPGRPATLRGDLTGDNLVSAADIDRLYAAIREMTTDARFDLDRNQVVDQRDVDFLVGNLLGTTYGDVNFDGVFNSLDLVTLFRFPEYEDDQADNSTWIEGDWNGDGEFDTQDLVFVFQLGVYRG